MSFIKRKRDLRRASRKGSTIPSAVAKRTTHVAESDIKAISLRAKNVLKSRYPPYLTAVVDWMALISMLICVGRVYAFCSGNPTTNLFLIWAFRFILPLAVADTIWLVILVWKETNPERQIRASKKQSLLNLWIGIFCFHSVCFYENLIRRKKVPKMIAAALLRQKPTSKKRGRPELFAAFTFRASRDLWAAQACKNGIIPDRKQAWLSIGHLKDAE